VDLRHPRRLDGHSRLGISATMDILLSYELQERVSDNHYWKVAANGKYSAKVAYENFFLGSIDFESF
jgi:hypothetical protein